MIAADSSSLVEFLAGSAGADVELVDHALAAQQLALPPAVLTEVLSAADRSPEVAALLLQLPLLEPGAGYWARAGLLRAKLRARGVKARLADALIAQSCVDYEVPLITRDRDFRHFTALGLQLRP